MVSYILDGRTEQAMPLAMEHITRVLEVVLRELEVVLELGFPGKSRPVLHVAGPRVASLR